MQDTWDKYKVIYKKRVIHKCIFCNKDMELLPSENKKFCSVECYKNYCKQKRDNNIQKFKSIYKCEICGNEISPENKRIYKRRFCSKKCYNTYREDSCRNRIYTKCGFCEKDIEIIQSRALKNEKSYCSQECMAEDYKERFKGENSPSWNGGKKHYQGDWCNARNKARERDCYKCQICEITEEELGKQMDVHHKKGYKTFENKYKANELDNLVCLCWRCHIFVHSKDNVDFMYLEGINTKYDKSFKENII